MKFKLTVSALIVAVATCTKAVKSEHGDDAMRKRGLVIGDQPLLIAEETPANTADVVVANDPAAVVPGVAGAQPPTMLLDSSFANLRNAPMGYVQVQQAPAAQQLMFTAPAPGLSPAGFQRFVDAPQIFIQAQPAVSSVAPITIIQAMSAATMIMPSAASVTVAVPATPTTSAAAAASTMPIVAAISSSTASVATPVAASVATPVSTSAVAAVAAPAAAAPIAAPAAPAPAAPAAPAVAPVAPAAPLAPAAYQVPVPGYAPAPPVAPLNYSDMVLVPQPALAGLAEPAAAPVYAQQQLYPVAAAPIAPPALQPGLSALLAKEAAAYFAPLGGATAAAAAAAANTLPTTVLGGAVAGSQAIVPIDPALADLLTQSLLAAAASQKSSAAALAHATALAGADDDTADAGQSAAADDTAEEPATSHRREKPAVKSAKARANARKVKQSASIANVATDVDVGAADANVDPDADASASAVAAAAMTADDGSDGASADDVMSTSIASITRKRKGSAKTVSAGVKKGAARSTMDDLDSQLASVMNYRASATVDGNETTTYDDASTIDSATDASYVRLPGSRQRSNIGNIKEEASRAKVEASAEAREAVLAEIRAEASAEAALQASAELHLSPKSIVHDEAAIMERESSTFQALQQFTREQSRGNYAEETALSKVADTDSFYPPATERTATAEGDRSSVWDALRSASLTGGRSAYSEDTQSPLYHAYEPTESESYDKYSRDQLPYTDLAKDSSMGSDWKVHYNGASPTMYTAGEEPSYTTYYNSDSHSYYTDNYNLHYGEERQGTSERGYEVSTSKPFNFMNRHADSAFARDAAGDYNWGADGHQSAATNAPHAVNDLDPLSYATQVCSFRNTLPLVASPDYTPFSAHPSIMVIGVPQTATSTVSIISTAPVPATSTVMMTKLVTPAVKVVYASND
ncbi:hypothetical protein GGI17_000057 [Coemansia sp. S146]|nr:hypothetical protein GGI17_000057 [Coemansia sp. S146]